MRGTVNAWSSVIVVAFFSVSGNLSCGTNQETIIWRQREPVHAFHVVFDVITFIAIASGFQLPETNHFQPLLCITLESSVAIKKKSFLQNSPCPYSPPQRSWLYGSRLRLRDPQCAAQVRMAPRLSLVPLRVLNFSFFPKGTCFTDAPSPSVWVLATAAPAQRFLPLGLLRGCLWPNVLTSVLPLPHQLTHKSFGESFPLDDSVHLFLIFSYFCIDLKPTNNSGH